MPKYSETHHLDIDDAGLASVHVAVHLKDADPRIARLLVLRVLDTASTIAYLDPLILPQTSGPCVHYDERSEHAADADPCTYPYGDEHSDGVCPHLDNPEILCPVKDACYAMRDVARMRDECEQEQGEQDADMTAREPVYETETPEFVEPAPDEVLIYEIVIPPQSKRKDGWSEDEMWVIARTDTPVEAVEAYRFRFPDSTRTDQAIKSQWRKLRSQPPRIRKPPQMAAVAPSQTYETAAPEFVELEPDDGAPHTYTVPATRKPTNPNAWSDEEVEVIRRAQSAAEAGRLYVDAFPESNRTMKSVSSRWYKLRAAGKLIEPEPEEPDFIVPHPTFRPGDRVRIKHALHRGQTGEIRRYFPATENYLVAIDGMPDMIVLTDAQMEAV